MHYSIAKTQAHLAVRSKAKAIVHAARIRVQVKIHVAKAAVRHLERLEHRMKEAKRELRQAMHSRSASRVQHARIKIHTLRRRIHSARHTERVEVKRADRAVIRLASTKVAIKL